jgi:hypothetical protein
VLVSVLTCSRPGGASYVEQTLAALDAALGSSVPKLLVSDGGVVACDGWQLLSLMKQPRTSGQIDNKRAGWYAIREARKRDCDLLFMEDDVLPLTPSSVSTMTTHEVPAELAWTSFFHRLRQPGMYPCAIFDMSQALLIPRRSIEWLADCGRGDWQRAIGFDVAMAVAGKARGARYELAPNEVAHVGLVSAVH